jgi:putative RecB family exonuclease
MRITNAKDLDKEFGQLGLTEMSWSRVDTYDWCPKKYKLQYCEKHPQSWAMPLALGSLVHDSLEAAIRFKVEDTDELVGFYIDNIAKHDPDHKLTDDEIQHGRSMTIDTFEHISSTVDGLDKIIEAELGFKYMIGRGLFTGFIDLAYWDKDELGSFISIVDYKTGSKGKKKTKTHGQTKLYTLAVKSMFPGERVKASLFWLKIDEIDTYEYSDEELEKFRAETEVLVSNIIEDEKFAHTNVMMRCSYCGFATKEVCPYGTKMAEKWSMIMNRRKNKD